MNSLISLLRASFTLKIKGQVDHLKAVAQKEDKHDPDSKERWETMHEGARTLFEVMDSEIRDPVALEFMSAGMTLAELTHYRDSFTQKISAIADEPKVTIYGVMHDSMTNSWHKEFGEAKKALLLLIGEDLDEDDNYHVRFEIKPKAVAHSEVSRYVNDQCPVNI